MSQQQGESFDRNPTFDRNTTLQSRFSDDTVMTIMTERLWRTLSCCIPTNRGNQDIEMHGFQDRDNALPHAVPDHIVRSQHPDHMNRGAAEWWMRDHDAPIAANEPNPRLYRNEPTQRYRSEPNPQQYRDEQYRDEQYRDEQFVNVPLDSHISPYALRAQYEAHQFQQREHQHQQRESQQQQEPSSPVSINSIDFFNGNVLKAGKLKAPARPPRRAGVEPYET